MRGAHFLGKMRYAILLDGAFVAKRFRAAAGRPAQAADVVALCNRIRGSEVLHGLTLLRIYWYDSPPATETIFHPVSKSATQLARSMVFRWATALHDQLEMQPDFALRMGEVSVQNAWTISADDLKQLAADVAAGKPQALRPEAFKPRIEQKGVDLRIGLDIARLALRGFVSTIVVVSGDSDMIPAFRFARREGVRVCLDTVGFSACKRDLKAHADHVLHTPLLSPVTSLPDRDDCMLL